MDISMQKHGTQTRITLAGWLFVAASLSMCAEARAQISPKLNRYLINYLGEDAASTRVLLSDLVTAPEAPVIVVYYKGPALCGSAGCNMQVLQETQSSYKVLSTTTIVQLPIRKLDTYSHGQPDLGIRVCGGGILRCYEAQLRFDGKRYPGNPSVAPAMPMHTRVAGTSLITDQTPSIHLQEINGKQ